MLEVRSDKAMVNITTVKIEVEKLDASLFKIPDGYKYLDNPGFQF